MPESGSTAEPSPAGAPPPARGTPRWVAPLLLILLALAAFSTSFPGAYIYDDLSIVADNPLIETPSLGRLLAADWWGHGVNSRLHRPIPLLSFAAVRLLFGLSAPPQHAVNVVLHVLLVVLLWRLWLALGIDRITSWLAAAAFAVHPIHTEVVDMVVGRAEILAALGVCGGLWAFLAGPGPWGRRWLIFPAYALALFSKESAVAFPLILLLADAWRSGFREAIVTRWPLHLGTSMVSAAWLGSRLLLPSAGLPIVPPMPIDNPLAALPMPARLATAAWVQALYLGKTIWPGRLAATYVDATIGPITRPLSAGGLAVALGTVALAILCLWGWRHRRSFALGLAFHAAAFTVMSNLFVLTPFLMAERFAYLPSAGTCLALASIAAWPLARPTGPRLRTAALVFAAAWLIALAGRTALRSLDFSDPVLFWEREAARAPNNARAWFTLGGTAARFGLDARAEEAFNRAISANPEFVEAYLGYALFLVDRARPDQAMIVLQPVLEGVGSASPLAMIIISNALLLKGSPAEALWWLDQTPGTHRPREWWELRAKALDGLNRPGDAAVARERALREAPVLGRETFGSASKP
jgi:tetratricopeptide (TPR) repeat protein